MNLRILSIDDRALFERYLRAHSHGLAVYSFANIFIWTAIYRVVWCECGGSLCVFFEDHLGSFMNLPPLGEEPDGMAAAWAFEYMDSKNSRKEYSRIENVEAGPAGFYGRLGYSAVCKPPDYVYRRSRLASLAGDPYKAKRANCNYFEKHSGGRLVPYAAGMHDECVRLYDDWEMSRAAGNPDALYRGLLRDSRKTLLTALAWQEPLRLTGRVAVVDGVIKGFTFGYEVRPDMFCILFEVADLGIKGLSQWMFRQFCKELAEYEYINAMDDSGIPGLCRVKESYCPCAKEQAFIIQRDTGARS